MRQRKTGKTTLLKEFARTTYSLDKGRDLRFWGGRLHNLLEKGPFPVLIDEAQKLPRVFDEVKGLVDDSQGPERFLLTGSVRVSAKKDIRESLTGRTLVLELLPLTLAEPH